MEFLLTKMQVPLREVGRLKEFNEAVDRTVGYYGTEKLENLRDESLSRYGRALHLETETRQLEGRFDDALKAAIVAAEMTGAVLRRAPSEPERVSDHGQSEFWLGNLTLARNPREAISHFASYVDLTEQARKARPDMLAWQANAARAHNSLALALFRAGDLDPSLAEFTLANATWAQIRKDHPDDHQARQAAANTLNLTSDVLKAQGKMQAAVAVQEQSLALTEPAYILDKNDRDAQYRLATVERRIARLAFEVGDAARSLDHLEKARDHGIELLQHDPENILWQDSLAMTVADFAAAEVLTGSLAKAAAELGRPESSRVLTTGAKLGVWNNRLQALIAARAADARVSMAHGEVRRAVALAEANARDLSVLSGTPPPDAVVATGETEIMLGDALDQAGDKEAALSHWRNAERLQDRPLGLRATYVAMQALCRRGDGSGASTLAAELKAAGYARSLSAAVIDKCRK